MGLVTGKTAAIAACLDAQAVLIVLKRQITPLLAGIDEAITVDMQDDGLWKEADDNLTTALTLENVTDIHAEVLKAQRSIRKGMTIDFSDLTKEKIKAALVPQEEKIDDLLDTFRQICGKLEGKE